MHNSIDGLIGVNSYYKGYRILKLSVCLSLLSRDKNKINKNKKKYSVIGGIDYRHTPIAKKYKAPSKQLIPPNPK